ncbi:unnamed protein product [Paramecium primaurelia]|uniref:GOLD domain-containing protein n=2 Tax=Paramecium TaxID=5884 RepID=A0A8S1T6T2_9CILI|nr:unnamed protein product [Paramecium primaurelia]CAD8146724.1 unnamed protein product [Paramecium pentaurelia]
MKYLFIYATFLVSVYCFYDFIPDDIITFTLTANQEDVLLENITEPTLIKGAYQVNHHKDVIDFSVKTPTGRTIYSKMATNKGNFTVQANEIGLYQIIFNNKKKANQLLTYAVDVVKEKEDKIKSTDIDPLELDIDYIHIGLQELYYDHKFQQIRYESSTQQVKEANKKIYAFTVIETIFIVLVTIWQIWYIKRLYNKRSPLLL